MEKVASQLLLSLGLHFASKRYMAILEILLLLSADIALLKNMHTLYILAGQRCGATPAAIDKRVRCAIAQIWQNRSRNHLQNIYNDELPALDPCARKFLIAIMQFLAREYPEIISVELNDLTAKRPCASSRHTGARNWGGIF